jgi:hypothetical protein
MKKLLIKFLNKEIKKIVSGALYDFAGFLIARDEEIKFGASNDCSLMVKLMNQWELSKGKLFLKDADVEKWDKKI